MALSKVIFDNTVFNYMLKVKSVNLDIIFRSLISEHVIIPSQIIAEMENYANFEIKFKSKILKWIDQSHQKNFYLYCDKFDSVILDNILKKLDRGEAGAIAQAEKIKVFWFISDDYKNIPFVKQNYEHIRQHSIFFMIALADILSLLADYDKLMVEILEIKDYKNFKISAKKDLKSLIRRDYIAAMKHLGIREDRKKVSIKCSIDTILKKNLEN